MDAHTLALRHRDKTLYSPYEDLKVVLLKMVEEMQRKLNIELLKEAYRDCPDEEVRNLIKAFIDRFENWLK